MADNEPATCTVELSTGSFVHLAHPPSHVLRLRSQAEDRLRNPDDYRVRESDHPLRDEVPPSVGPLVRFERITSPGLTSWRGVWVDVTQVVAVYAINARPEAPSVYSIIAAGGFVPPGA